MKKKLLLFVVMMCLLLCSCGKPEKLSIITPEKVYVTFYSGPDIHYWELSQDEISGWAAWMDGLFVSPINLEKSQMLIDYLYYNDGKPQYLFDVGPDDSLERIAYFDIGLEYGYLRIDDVWYCVDNPTEPFHKF